jgi:hypothetical protein
VVNVAQVFLLSPAFCGGRRAAMLMNPASKMELAQRLTAGTLTLGEAFAFMSGLYFRGKLSYARQFGAVLVITPTRGLQPPETLVTSQLLKEFARVDVDSDDRRYRKPLDRDLQLLASQVGVNTRVILLGSIATGKYVDALTAALGPRLHYPSSFVGRGDMSRGGLLLRAVTANEELEYAPLVAGPAHTARQSICNAFAPCSATSVTGNERDRSSRARWLGRWRRAARKGAPQQRQPQAVSCYEASPAIAP